MSLGQNIGGSGSLGPTTSTLMKRKDCLGYKKISSLRLAGSSSAIHTFISGMRHYECVAPNVDTNHQSWRFWAKSIASFRERLNDSRSCWCEGVLVVSFSSPGGELLRSAVSSGRRAMWPNKERRRAWTMHGREGRGRYSLYLPIDQEVKWIYIPAGRTTIHLAVRTHAEGWLFHQRRRPKTH